MSSGVTLRKRTTVVLFLLAAVLVGLVFRLGWVQLVRGDELQSKALDNRLRKVAVEARRGEILDRQGRQLAVSVSTPSIGAYPPEVRRSGQVGEITAQLAPILGVDAALLESKLSSATAFVWLKRKARFEAGEQVKELDLPGVTVVDESQRFYPNGTLAAHVLGFAGIDNQGLEGLEITYDQELRGTPGWLVVETDGVGREVPQAVHQFTPPVDGNTLVLTLDETIQYLVERELDELLASATSPKSASIIVLDVLTGGILALASRPNFDPNYYNEYPAQSWRNIAVSNSFEPGSTFKIVTTAAALQEGVVKPDDRFYDPGYIKVGKETIKCWRSYNPHGSESFAEGVQNSCNPVFVEVGLRLEEKQKGLFYKYIRDFGFGQPTGIDLPGEASGILIPENKLKQINVATISIGQGIAVTPLQLVSAAATVANGGKLLQPRLLQEIRDPKGRVLQRYEPEVRREVLTPTTSQAAGLLLEGVVSQGTGSRAYIQGYRVGGKTGTAQKAGAGGYQAGKYVASFVGFAPVNDPRLAVLVMIDEPQGVYYGGQIAAPIFQRVMRDALRSLEVQPQFDPSKDPGPGRGENAPEDTSVPVVVGLPLARAEAALRSVGLKVETIGEGDVVVRQTPQGQARVVRGTKVLLYLGISDPGQEEELSVPDLTGRRIWEAISLLEALGLNLKPQGSGEAVEQTPVPGSKLPPGATVQVIFHDPVAVSNLGP